MNIAITGSNGYCGNFLAEYLCKKGHRVIGIDLASMDRQKEYPNFRFVKCDVRDEMRLMNLFFEEQITHVLHLAFLMEPQHDRNFEYDVDVSGSCAVFHAANNVKSVRQFVHFSSASVYGAFPDNEPGIPETQEPRPRDWVYAQNKVLVEQYMLKHPKRKDLKVVQYRMCTAVGPSYHKHGGVVSALGGPIGVLLSGKDTDLQLIHEDDVKRLTELILEDPEIEGFYNLAPDSHAPTRELNPRRWKLFLPLPKFLFYAIIAFLWGADWFVWKLLRKQFTTVAPTSVNLIAHGIVMSPQKLMDRYGYTFEYSTKEAFFDAYWMRKENGTL